MKKTKGLSTAELIGLEFIEETYFQTTEGEKTVFFLLKPSNLSVLSNESLNAKIYGLIIFANIAERFLMSTYLR